MCVRGEKATRASTVAVLRDPSRRARPPRVESRESHRANQQQNQRNKRRRETHEVWRAHTKNFFFFWHSSRGAIITERRQNGRESRNIKNTTCVRLFEALFPPPPAAGARGFARASRAHGGGERGRAVREVVCNVEIVNGRIQILTL